jgi:tetratricopeptide (TPR) repeat protein
VAAARTLAIFALLCSVAHAANDEARARVHFEKGRTHYDLGNYKDALREFTAGYKVVRKPGFLINIAQCFRKLGDDASAKQMLERFMQESPPDDELREQAKKYLAELGATWEPPPQETLPPAATPAPPPPTAQPAPVVTAEAPTPPKKKSGVRHLAWALPLTAVVVVGVTLGLYFGLTDPCREGTIGCVHP